MKRSALFLHLSDKLQFENLFSPVDKLSPKVTDEGEQESAVFDEPIIDGVDAMNIKISKLNIHDYHKCSNIWNMEKQKELADIFYKEILSGNRAVYIYSIDDEYIAEISLVYKTDDEDYTIPSERAYVSRLVVKKSFRRRGIGKELVEFIKAEAKNQGFSELSIGVNLDNYAAMRLYASSGFDKIIRIDEDKDGKFAKLLCVLQSTGILEA